MTARRLLPSADNALLISRTAFAAAIGSVPISTAATSFFLGLGFLAWLGSGRISSAWQIVRTEPLAGLATMLFVLLALSALWSAGPLHEQLTAMGKFRKLLLIIVVASVFDDFRWRQRALAAGLLAGGITLALSYYSVVFDYQFPVSREFLLPDNHIVFKQHITQGWMMGLFAFACLAAASCQTDRRLSWGLAGLGILAAINNLNFVQGRTGYVATLVLLGVWFVLRYRRRGVLLATLALAVVGVVLINTSSTFAARVQRTIDEYHQVVSGSTAPTSVSERMAFYRNSLTLVEQSPWIGHGLGSMATVYAPLTVGKQGAEAIVTGNPHNEYFNLTIQAGVGACALYLGMLIALGRRARQAQGLARWIGLGLAVLMGVTSLLNSTLWDYNEGVMFALLAGWTLAAARDRNPDFRRPL